MKRKMSLPVLAVSLATATLAAGCGGTATTSTGSTSAAASSAASSNAAAAPAGGPVLPVPKNPIVSTATASGLKITRVLVENNVDPATGKGTDDHLEVALKNTSGKAVDRVEVYYKITDPSKNLSEGYYAKLPGVAIAPGATQVVNFDNTGKSGHIPVNKYSLYYTDKNALVVDVTAVAAGVKLDTFTVKKDSGGAEAGVE